MTRVNNTAEYFHDGRPMGRSMESEECNDRPHPYNLGHRSAKVKVSFLNRAFEPGKIGTLTLE